MISTTFSRQIAPSRAQRAFRLVSLIQALDEAIELGTVEEQVQAVKEAVVEASKHADFLPAKFRVPVEDRYARRPLYIDPAGRFSVLVMVWSKGQSTPLHDHGGAWVVECLLEGKMRVTNFAYGGEVGGLHQFIPGEVQRAAPGDADYRIPPEEHHVLENDREEPSITIHVFGGLLSSCDVFEPVEGGYHKVRRTMSYTE